MGGVGAEVVFETREPLVCQNSFDLFVELAENSAAER